MQLSNIRRRIWKVYFGLFWRLHMNAAWLLKRRVLDSDGKVVVNLTTYPPRFEHVYYTLLSLLLQSFRDFRLVLWVAERDLKKLPPRVLALKKWGLEINGCPDLKSYKKIIPALSAFPGATIVIADDDVFYWTSWLAELVEGAKTFDGVLCHRMHRVQLKSGSILPYQEWEWCVQDEFVDPRNFPTGAGGVLYPPDSFDAMVTDAALALELCPRGDDIWLYWMARRNGKKTKWVESRGAVWTWPDSQGDAALWRNNVEAGGNDRQVESMMAKFGLPFPWPQDC